MVVLYLFTHDSLLVAVMQGRRGLPSVRLEPAKAFGLARLVCCHSNIGAIFKDSRGALVLLCS